MDVVDNNDFLHVFHVFGCWKQYLDFTWMLYIMMTSFVFFKYLVVWKQYLHSYMDVVDNNDFLFMYFLGCWKHYIFGCFIMDVVWIILMTSLMFSCIWLLKTIFWFYMDVVDNNVVDNNDFLHVFHVFGFWKQYLDFTWMYIMMTSFVFFIYLVV